MSQWKKLLPKSFTTVACLVLVAGSISYAILSSQRATLQGNTIQTSNANLTLSTDGTTYGTTLSGFNFQNLIPGGPAVPQTGYLIYLRNTGGAVLSPTLSITSAVSNPDAIDLSQVNVIITAVNGGQSQTISLQDLINAGKNNTAQLGFGLVPATNIFPLGSLEYRLQVQMTSAAAVSGGTTLSNIDLSFNGVAVAP